MQFVVTWVWTMVPLQKCVFWEKQPRTRPGRVPGAASLRRARPARRCVAVPSPHAAVLPRGGAARGAAAEAVRVPGGHRRVAAAAAGDTDRGGHAGAAPCSPHGQLRQVQ
eukprot:gene24398-biopygen19414